MLADKKKERGNKQKNDFRQYQTIKDKERLFEKFDYEQLGIFF
jgi:hypothetical protein